MKFKNNMKIILAPVLLLFSHIHANAQESKLYFSSGGELIFSWANVDDNGLDGEVITRFSAFFHFQSLTNYDFSNSVGAFWGLAIRNVGFIYKDPNNTAVRKKYRTYNLGFPVGFKFGDLGGRFIYVGYELELPFNYKEKTFISDKKQDKFNEWFSSRSSRTPFIHHSLFVGITGIRGASIKFKYYLTNFFNKDFTDNETGFPIKPFENFDVNLFYVSLNLDLFKNTTFIY